MVFIQRRISFLVSSFSHLIFCLPREKTCGEREKRTLSQGFYFLQSFTLLASPGVSLPTHSLTQPGEKLAGTRPTLVTVTRILFKFKEALAEMNVMLGPHCVFKSLGNVIFCIIS